MYLVTTSNTIKVIFMNIFYDANKIYEAGTKAIQGAPFKYQSQLFEMNHLIETAQILKDLLPDFCLVLELRHYFHTP